MAQGGNAGHTPGVFYLRAIFSTLLFVEIRAPVRSVRPMTQPSEPAPWRDSYDPSAPVAPTTSAAGPVKDGDAAALAVPWTPRQTWIGVGVTLGPWLLLALATLALSSRTPSSSTQL